MQGDNYRQLLIDRQKELAELAAAADEVRRPVLLDQTSVGRLSRMDALQSQAMALEIERRRNLELLRIDAALKRIDEGEFGYCVVCGEDIPEKRMLFDPAVPTCVDCARRNT